MVVSNNETNIDHIKFLVNQAKDRSREYYHSEIGFNYRMTNIEAALGLAQMERLGQFLEKKKKINEIYRKELKDIGFVHFQKEYKGAKSSWWLSCIVFEKEINLPNLQEKLKAKDIPTRRIFMPVIESPPYKIYKHTDCENSYHIYKKGLCLPSSTLNSEEDIYYVCEAIKKIIQDE